MKKLLVLLLLIYPLTAAAVTYEWTDDSGTVNFTEDLGKVPKKFRKRVKVLGADDAGTPQVIENNPPEKGGAKDAAAPKEKKGSESSEAVALRKEYGQANAQLKVNQQEAADLRARLADTSNMSRNEYLTLQNSLKQTEFRLKGLTQRVDQLRQEAQKAGVNLEGK